MKSNNPFNKTLIKWYLANSRELPWRHTKDPYLIWVSEIILQQTRVSQGIDFYLRFISRFPDIQSLADSDEEQVLKLWEGLGYYSRARNMYKTACHLTFNNNSHFPENLNELMQLKGIGRYTAAAIASMAFNKATAVVDGNVIRFLSRYFGIEAPVGLSKTIKQITYLANELLNKHNPGLFNQAMMEFGALQCIPANPNCKPCCFSEKCVAYQSGKVDKLPIKVKKSTITERYFNYLVVQQTNNGSHYFLTKRRSAGDIWKHLYDFPLIETSKLLDVKQLIQNEQFKNLFSDISTNVLPYPTIYRHLLTHRVIHARFFLISILSEKSLYQPNGYICTDNIRQYPLPTLISNFLKQINS